MLGSFSLCQDVPSIRRSLAASNEVTSTRKLNGRVADIGQFPWHAYFEIYGIDDPSILIIACSGVLISNLYVLSSAHCFVPIMKSGGYVQIGLSSNYRPFLRNLLVDNPDVTIHEKFKEGSHLFDLAVVRLPVNVYNWPKVSRLFLLNEHLPEGEIVSAVSGFDLPHKTDDEESAKRLIYGHLKTVPPRECGNDKPENLTCMRKVSEEKGLFFGDR